MDGWMDKFTLGLIDWQHLTKKEYEFNTGPILKNIKARA